MPTTEYAMTLAAVTEAEQGQVLSSSMVGRMTLILDAFGKRGTRLTLEEVERRTSLPRSTAHRILNQLIQLGWIARGDHGYTLGSRALRAGGGASSWDELRRAAASVLHALQVHTGLVVHLGVLDGPEVVFLDKIGGAYAATLPSDVGTRWWATNNVLGRAMLAYLPPEHVQDLLRGCPELLGAADESFTSIHCELNVIRRMRGLSFERDGMMPGVGSVACAILAPDGPAGAISLCGDLAQMHLERLAPLVAAAARQVSEALYPKMAEPGDGEMFLRGGSPAKGRLNISLPREAAREWFEGPYGGGCCGQKAECGRRRAV